MVDLEAIKNAFANGLYQYTAHALKRSIERHIRVEEVEEAVANAEVLEYYPNDKYGASCLIYGSTLTMRPIHMVLTCPPADIKLITVYEPHPDEWIDNRIRR